MATIKVNKNATEKVNNNDKLQGSLNEALRDAETKLREAQRQVMDWKAVIRACRERIARKIPWPGSTRVSQH